VPRLVDLSQEIYQGMGVYPGHLKTVIWEHASHEETAKLFEGGFSFCSSGIMMCDHGPTHVDALAHLDPREGAATIDEMPLDTFFGPALCLDVSHVRPPDYVTAGDLEDALGASGQELRQGDALLLRTGDFERHAGTPSYTREYTGLDDGAAGWLKERGVKIFGVDSPSPDNPISRTYPVHMMCRESGITHYENLANLDAVTGRRFTFMGFPLRIRQGTGSPVRAVALLED
jgi:kynurenine formamidase